jgi:hypothetical protein
MSRVPQPAALKPPLAATRHWPAARDMPSYRIQQHTRHKSAQMVAAYIREADKWTSGLKGVGF